MIWPQLLDPFAHTPRTLPPVLQNASLAVIPYALIALLASLVGTVITAIGWHRFVVKDAREPRWLIGGRNWPLNRYFWTSLLLILIGLIPLAIGSVTPIGRLIGDADTGSSWTQFLSLTASAYCLLLPVHFLGLVLPGIAIGQRISIAQSLKQTLPHTLSILVLTGLVALAFSIPDSLITTYLGPTTHVGLGIAGWGAVLLYAVISWLALVLTVGVLSELFLKLVNNSEPDSPTR